MDEVINECLLLKESKIHNWGVFARKFIPKGAMVIQYVGEKISKEESDKRIDKQLELNMSNPSVTGANYIFELDDDWDLDGDVDYNPAKYINHSCQANCEVEIEGDKIFINSIRDIEVGEEISYNYCYDLEDFEENPCRCGSEGCVGFIVDDELWPQMRELLSSKKK